MSIHGTDARYNFDATRPILDLEQFIILDDETIESEADLEGLDGIMATRDALAAFLGTSDVTGFYQTLAARDLADRTGLVVIVYMYKSGAVLFRPHMAPKRVLEDCVPYPNRKRQGQPVSLSYFKDLMTTHLRYEKRGIIAAVRHAVNLCS